MTDQQAQIQKWTYLIILVFLMWEMLPDHKKHRTLMKVADSGRRKAQSLAESMGKQGIASELRGEQRAANYLYHTAYKLMTGAHRYWERQYEIHRG